MTTDQAPSQGSVTDEEFRARLISAPVPRWVQDMMEFYRQYGYYRPEDIARFLGDQTKPTTTIMTAIHQPQISPL